MERRVKNIYKNLENKLDVILIKNSIEPYIDDNFFYVTGLEKGLFEGCVAFLSPEGNIDLVVSELEEESAKKSDANVKVYKSSKDFEDLLKERISYLNKKTLFSRIAFIRHLIIRNPSVSHFSPHTVFFLLQV